MVPALVWSVLGCAQEEPPVDTDTDVVVVDDSCGDTAPTVSNVGVLGAERDGVFFTVYFDVNDADGALHQFSFRVWLDDVVDGVVDTSGAPFQQGDIEPDDAGECGLDQYFIIAASEMGVDNDLAYNALYEVAVEVVDADDHRSAIVIASGYSPNEDGTPGGP